MSHDPDQNEDLRGLKATADQVPEEAWEGMEDYDQTIPCPYCGDDYCDSEWGGPCPVLGDEEDLGI